MNHWVLAFVGDGARENLEVTRRTGVFCILSDRTPMRRAGPGDRALLYVAGEGFMAEARISSPARGRTGEAEWSSKKPPVWDISVSGLQPFSSPIPYKFPGKGDHAVLGFRSYALTSGFLAIPESGFEDVISRAAREPADGGTPAREAATAEPPVHARPESSSRNSAAAAKRSPDPGKREKRAAGQHAVGEGRKRTTLWTVAEMGASILKLKGVERLARGKARDAERTWLAGGRAEERVGAELERLTKHGLYLFHDVSLPGLGNVDHVVLGEKGFYCIETKSHKGRVAAREGGLVVNGRTPEKDFINQTWRGCYRLREILDAEVAPILLFTDAFVRDGLRVRGVRVLPLPRLVEEILGDEKRHDRQRVKTAVNALGDATECYPSAVPRRA